jgi:putative endopeptidase
MLVCALPMRRSSLPYVPALGIIAACASSPPQTKTVPTAVASTTPPAAPPLTLAQAGIIPSWMDAAADPCQDFFAYACGGFVKSETIPADRATWGATEGLQKSNEEFLRAVLESAASAPGGDPVKTKIGDYYAACMDDAGREKAGVAPIQALLDVAAQPKDFATLAEAVTKLHQSSVFALFSTSSEQDFVDATRVIAGLDQSGLGLPDRDYYLENDPAIASILDFYAGHVARMFALTGMKAGDANEAAADVMRIETKIARLEQDKVARRDPRAIYHRVDRAGLPGIARTFPWDAYFAAMGVPGIQEISVNDPAYFTGIDALMHQEPAPAFRHYLAWRVLDEEAPRLSKAFVDESFAMRKKLTGQEVLPAPWKRCVQSTDAALGELVAQPYVAERFGGDSKERARAIVSGIHAAMRAELQGLPWMDDATRAAALAKLQKINDKVGYPDTWRVYDYDVSRASYAANTLADDRFERHRDLAKIGKPVDRAEWLMTPPTVNAYYLAGLNEICLPAGQLQPPFFSRDYYTPVNLGEIGGNTIGHELTHAFDDEGSQFDGDGNLRDWWSLATKAKFAATTRCVQDQYSLYEPVPGVKLNGALTSGENIADIGGVKLGYAALVAWKAAHPEEHRAVDGFTDEQIFFIGYAQGWCTKERPEVLAMRARTDVHSPARFRVNGPMADVTAFADAYRCKPGTPMNTGAVCSVW